MKRSIKVHINTRQKKTGDASLSSTSVEKLMKMWRDPGIDERESGAALQELVRRGVDPKTGKHVGVASARQTANEIGENANG